MSFEVHYIIPQHISYLVFLSVFLTFQGFWTLCCNVNDMDKLHQNLQYSLTHFHIFLKSFAHYIVLFPWQQSLTLREKVTRLNFKEKSSDDTPSYKYLLLWIVRLVHADPIVMLHVSGAIYWSCLVTEIFAKMSFYCRLSTFLDLVTGK